MRKAILLIVLSFLLHVFLLNPAHAAAEKKSFVFGMNFEDTLGGAASQWLESVDEFGKALSENYGINLKLKKIPSHEDIMKNALEGKIDMFFIYDSPKVLEKYDHLKVWPLATLSIEGSKRSAPCLWKKRGTALNTAEDLRGKNLMVVQPAQWNLLRIRDLLYQNGIDEPLWMVFPRITKISSSNSSFMAVAMGKADVVFGWSLDKATLSLMNAEIARKMEKCFCGVKDHGNSILVLNQRTTSKSDYTKLQDIVSDFIKRKDEFSRKYTKIQMIWRFMKLMKAEIVPADGTEYDGDLALSEKSKTNGWIIEANYLSAFLDKAPMGQPVELKPDYAICKKFCAGKKLECVDKCMK